MDRFLRLALSLLLALLLSVQCFAAAFIRSEPTDEPPEPVESAEPTQSPEPETDAPAVLQAQVRPTDSDNATELSSALTLPYQSGVYHFLLADPAGESGQEPSGVDLSSCLLYVDECPLSDVTPDETDMSLTASLTLPNGRHVLRLIVRDRDGNQTEADYIVTIAGDDHTLPVYTVFADADYAPLGGQLRITIRTPNAAYLSALHVALKADPVIGEDGFDIEACSGFMLDESSVAYDAEQQMIRFRVRANMTLTGERDIAVVSVAVPENLQEGSTFAYEIPGAWAETRRNDMPDYHESFSLAQRTVPVDAPYVLTVDDLYVGMTDSAYIRVTDRGGSKAYHAQVMEETQGFLGITNWIGQLAVPGSMLASPGSHVLYAVGEIGRSFPVEVTVADAVENEASPLSFRAQADPSGSKTVSWLSPLRDTVLLRWAENISELSKAEPVAVSTERVPFGGVMAQINTCTISGLKPGSAGYLQTSFDGREWSAVEAFSVSDFSEGTKLAVLGSLADQEDQTLTPLIEAVRDACPQLVGLLGNAVSDASSYPEWTERLASLDAVGSADLLLVPGADVSGRTASAVSAQPNRPYSYEYGDVYIAVIPGAADSDALDWLIRDAAASECMWKVLLTAAPVADSDRPALEQAGIHFSFADGSYARTPALSGGLVAESYDDASRTSVRDDGVVYVACGTGEDLTWVSADASEERLVLTAYRVTEIGTEEIDAFTMLSSDCVRLGHHFSEQSVYDSANGTITCDRCGQAVPARESGYTGFVSLQEGRAWLERGYARTGWFLANGAYLHAGTDARIHKTVDFSTETCTEPGEKMAWCAECGTVHSYAAEVQPSGHRYDSAHHCTNTHYDSDHKTIPCGWTGVNLATLKGELAYLYGFYSGEPLEPAVTVTTEDGAALNPAEYTVAYENNTEIGVAAVRLTGVNSYYGELVLPFEIRPCDVTAIRASDVGQTQLTLSWDAANGAQRYAVYQQTESGWKRLGDTQSSSFAVTGLSPGVLYTFRVRPFAIADSAVKRLDGSLDRTFWAAHHSESLEVRTEGIRFEDVHAEDWFSDSVTWAVDSGVTKGTDATHFSPEKDCTRGQMVTFLWRAKGSPEPAMRSSPFGDVSDPNTYYYKAVLWAVEQGITRGSSATTFSPDAPVTRGMVVTFLHRAAGAEQPKSGESPFVDVAPDQYFTQSVQWAVEQQITKGMDRTHFAPNNICTRAQIVTFLQRFMAL